MKTVQIGGVPEHFNYPWYLALKDKRFQQRGINLRWKDFYGGSGAMAKALEDGSIDLAVILTEGIVKAISDGNPSRIVQVYVSSPLLWGIHVARRSGYTSVSELRGTEAAISRFGSGSHLMAYVNAKNLGWDTQKDLNFELVRNLNGALEALPRGEADYFMWEKFTTKPYVDNGIFRCIGECPTPWPCFVIAAAQDFIDREPEVLRDILDLINEVTIGFKQIPDIGEVIAARYDQQPRDVQSWLELTHWSQQNLTSDELDEVQHTLLELGLIQNKLPKNQLLAMV